MRCYNNVQHQNQVKNFFLKKSLNTFEEREIITKLKCHYFIFAFTHTILNFVIALNEEIANIIKKVLRYLCSTWK